MKPLFKKVIGDFLFESFVEKPEFNFHQLNQTHSAIVRPAPCGNTLEGDGIVGHKHSLAVKTADCLPIAFIGLKGQALVHAGWKGLHLNILADDKIKEIHPTHAFIGPSIHACCFEVTEEFQAHFPNQPIVDGHFNLISQAQDQIRRLYALEAVDSGLCTCCDLRFPSFRRNKTTQRIWNILRYQAK